MDISCTSAPSPLKRALETMAALDAIARGAQSPAVTLDSDAAALDELPRQIVLPHYPWEREPPTAPAGDAREAEAQATALGALLALPATVRLDAVRGQVHHHIAVVLGHRDTTAIDETTSLFDYGLDSLMAVDLARALSATFAIELSFAQIS
jgi:acyl carrier protein